MVLAGHIDRGRSQLPSSWCADAIGILEPYGSGQAHFLAGDGACLAADRSTDLHRRGNLLVVLDGRIDNLPDLTVALSLSRETSATVTISVAWERWGPATLQQLVGDFALVVADLAEHSVWLARDPSGQRPLFYSLADGWLAFASMPTGLTPLIGPLEPNLGALVDLLALQPPSEDGLFRRVSQLRAGELLHTDRSGVRRSQWWQPSTDVHPRRSSASRLEEYRSLLNEAVRCRTPSKAIAVQLSSGWDSSAVAATAARLHGGQEVTAYTSAPFAETTAAMMRDRFADESPLAACTAAMHGMRHEVVRSGPSPLDHAREHARLVQMPALNPFNGSWWEEIRQRSAAGGSTVLLTGELGNLSMNAGGLAILPDILRQEGWRAWWHEARLAVAGGRVRWRGVLHNSFAHQLPQSLVQRIAASALGPPVEALRFVRPEWRKPFSAYQGSGHFARDRLEAIRGNDVGAWRLSAAAWNAPLELDPTADRRLLEFGLSLPPDQLLHDGEMRPLARAALADRVPAKVLDHPARGLQSADWYLRISQRQASEALEEMKAVGRARDLFDLEALADAIASWPSKDWNTPQVYGVYRVELVAALSTGLFLKEWTK